MKGGQTLERQGAVQHPQHDIETKALNQSRASEYESGNIKIVNRNGKVFLTAKVGKKLYQLEMTLVSNTGDDTE